jgi:hypothetical protein
VKCAAGVGQRDAVPAKPLGRPAKDSLEPADFSGLPEQRPIPILAEEGGIAAESADPVSVAGALEGKGIALFVERGEQLLQFPAKPRDLPGIPLGHLDLPLEVPVPCRDLRNRLLEGSTFIGIHGICAYRRSEKPARFIVDLGLNAQ